jgi:hypothetical protein
MRVINKMLLKYLKILYIEFLYILFSIIFLYKLNILNSKIMGENDLSILSYNNYEPIYFFIGAFILIVLGFYTFLYRFEYIFNTEISSIWEVLLFIFIELLMILIIIFIIKFISIPILKTIFKSILLLLGLFQFLSSK